jgi:drug/metabolite transporter (DMT)-like permease
VTSSPPRLPVRLTPRRADLVLALATLLWGLSFIVVKDALASSTPLAFTAARFALAAIVLTPFTNLRPPHPRAELRAGALLGGLLAVGFAAQTVGLVYTTPARSAFIVASSSVLAPIVALVVVRERPRLWVVVALGLAGVGMYLLTAPDAGGLNRGDAWTLVTALSFGGQIVAVAHLSRRHDPLRLVWMETVITAVGAALAAVCVEHVRMRWSPALAGALGYTAVLATALALVWQMRAQRSMSSARAALIFCAEPVFAALASWVWFGERLSTLQWAGGGLILVGMVLAEVPHARVDPEPV